MIECAIEHEIGGMERAGFIPNMLDWNSDRKLREQLDAGYQHGGGWHPTTVPFHFDPKTKALSYPGDPDFLPYLEVRTTSGERMFVYPGSWVLLLQRDGSYEIARMD